MLKGRREYAKYGRGAGGVGGYTGATYKPSYTESAYDEHGVRHEAWERPRPHAQASAPGTVTEGFYNHVPIETHQARFLVNNGRNNVFRPSDREEALLRTTDERQVLPQEFIPPIRERRPVFYRSRADNEDMLINRAQVENENPAFFGNAYHNQSVSDRLKRLPEIRPDEYTHAYRTGQVLVDRQTPQEAFASLPTVTQLKERGLVGTGQREPVKTNTRSLFNDSPYYSSMPQDADHGLFEQKKKNITGPGYSAPNPGQTAAGALPQNSRQSRRKQGEQMERRAILDPSVVAIDQGPKLGHDGLGHKFSTAFKTQRHRAPVVEPNYLPEHTIHSMGRVGGCSTDGSGMAERSLRRTKKYSELVNKRQRVIANGDNVIQQYGLLPAIIQETWDRTQRNRAPNNDSTFPDMLQAPSTYLLTRQTKRQGGALHRCAEVDPRAEADTLAAALNQARSSSTDRKWRDDVLTLSSSMAKVSASSEYKRGLHAPTPGFVGQDPQFE